MTAQAVLDASPAVERALAVLSLGLLGALVASWAFARGGREAGGAAAMEPSRRSELGCLALIVVGALSIRTVGWNWPLTAPFWFSETLPLYVAKMLRERTLWSQWLAMLHRYQVAVSQDSAVVVPIATGLQWLVGPSPHLPVLLGAVFGVSAVVLAWLLGRTMHSRCFGLVFAAFVALSPLEIVWSRLGGIIIASVPHVLLVLWLAYLAGKRRSFVLAVCTAVAVWTVLYEYYAARAAIPLALAAVLAATSDARRPWWQAVALITVVCGTVAAIYAVAQPPSIREALWPAYSGYVGNKGESTLAELVSKNVEEVVLQLQIALHRYFLHDRSQPEPYVLALRWGIQYGGLCLLPVVALGAIGLVSCLVGFRRHWLWLLLGGAGLALPVLSLPSARRFLIFDLAWCGFAAHGTLLLLRSPLARARTGRTLTVTVFVVLAAWSFGSVVLLNATLPAVDHTRIPFGESGLGDGVTCLRCLAAGREWQGDIERGALVILVDSDLDRENRTSPGGLPLYGKLAAVTAGRREAFVDFYAAMGNFDLDPPDVGPMYDAGKTNFPSYVGGRIDAAAPGEVVWHFERPTVWERWLAARLEEAGGQRREFSTPWSSEPGIQVRVPPAGREATVNLLQRLVQGPSPRDDRCPGLREFRSTRYPFPPLYLSPATVRADGVPEWLVGSWSTTRYHDVAVSDEIPIGSVVEAFDDNTRLHLLLRDGRYRVTDLPARGTTESMVRSGSIQGLDCAARAGEEWWIVNPTTGKLFSTAADIGWVPQGHWSGIARTDDGQLLLASGDQWMVRLDPNARTEVRRFPALVSPSRRVNTGECSQVVAGAGWYAALNSLTSELTVYDADGEWIGTRQLSKLPEIGGQRITALAATGRYLAVGYSDVVRTFEVTIPPDCVPVS